jgi:hypothetical protein
MHGSAAGRPERELTWLNRSQIVAITPDGRTALVCPEPPWCPRLRLVPTGPGAALEVPAAPVTSIARVRFLRDGKSIVFGALDSQGARSLWLQPLDGAARRLTGPGVTRPVPSPDGRWIAAVRDKDSALLRVSVETGELTELGKPKGLKTPVGWLDANSLIVWVGGAREELRRIDVKSGAQERWRTLGVPETAGVEKAVNVVIADDGSCAYSTRQMLGDLYLVEGLR